MTVTFNPSYAPMANARQYAAPDISRLLYEGIGNLPSDYYQGQQNAQQLALSRMFPQGLTPYMNRDGSLKQGAYADIANKAAQVGGWNAVQPLLNNLMLGQAANASAARSGAISRYVGDAPPDAGAPPPSTAPNTASPSSNTIPGRTPGPQSSAAPTAQPPEPTGGMDNLAGIATEHYGQDTPASKAIGTVARQMGVRPSDTLNVDQISDAKSRFASLNPDGTSAGPRTDTDTTSGPQPPIGQSADVTNVPRATSAQERGVNGSPGPAPEAPVGGAGLGAVAPAGIPQNRIRTQAIAPPGTPQQRVAQDFSQFPPSASLPLGAQPRIQIPGTPSQGMPLQGMPPQVAQAAPQPAQAGPLQQPQGYTQRDVQRLRAAQSMENQEAARLEGVPGGKALADEHRDRAKTYGDRASAIDKDIMERSQPTPPMKEALTPGVPQAISAKEGMTKFATAREEQYAKDANDVNAMAKRAALDLPFLQDASNRVDLDPRFYTGPFSAFVHHFQQGEWLLGGPRTANTANEMAIKEFANAELSAIRDLGNSGLGRILMREVQTVQKTIMNMGQTPETVRELLEIGIRTRNLMLASKEILKQHNGHADDDFQDDVIKYYQKHPIITQAEMENQKLIAPPRVQNEPDFQRLGIEPGDPFRSKDKDGNWRVKIYPGPRQQQP